MSQRKYAIEILEQTNYMHVKPGENPPYTPSISTPKLNEEENPWRISRNIEG